MITVIYIPKVYFVVKNWYKMFILKLSGIQNKLNTHHFLIKEKRQIRLVICTNII